MATQEQRRGRADPKGTPYDLNIGSTFHLHWLGPTGQLVHRVQFPQMKDRTRSLAARSNESAGPGLLNSCYRVPTGYISLLC